MTDGNIDTSVDQMRNIEVAPELLDADLSMESEIDEQSERLAEVSPAAGSVAVGGFVASEEQLAETNGRVLVANGSSKQEAATSTGRSHPRRRPPLERDTDDIFRLYLEDIGQHDLLTKEQEAELALRIEAGVAAKERLAAGKRLPIGEQRELKRTIKDGEDAHDEFVEANLRLVVSIAKKFTRSGMDLTDLTQYGNLGLIHAVDKFDGRKGFKFSTYATWWIRQAIQRGVANDSRTIRIPVHAGDLLDDVLLERHLMELTLGRKPTAAELAAELKISEQKILDVLRYATNPRSLDEPIMEDSEMVVGDTVEDRNANDPYEAALLSALPPKVQDALDKLDERERDIVVLRFGLDGGGERTHQEVADLFDLTRERIQQIQAKAFAKLREPSTDSDSLRDLISS